MTAPETKEGCYATILRGLTRGEYDLARSTKVVEVTLRSLASHPEDWSDTTGQLLGALQRAAPAEFANQVQEMSRSGIFLNVRSIMTDSIIVHNAMIVRSQLIADLSLHTTTELALLDTGLCAYMDAIEARMLAKKTGKMSDYARLIAVAEAAEERFNTVIQQLRDRNRRRTQEVHVVGAGSVAIQMNAGAPPVGNDPKPVTHTGASRAEQGDGTRFFGKNELRPPDGP